MVYLWMALFLKKFYHLWDFQILQNSHKALHRVVEILIMNKHGISFINSFQKMEQTLME